MDRIGIEISSERVAGLCREHGFGQLSLVGSVLRDDFRAGSDVDVLVDFEPGVRIGLVTLAGLELELSQIVGRKVDVTTREDLSRCFRQQALDSALLLYSA